MAQAHAITLAKELPAAMAVYQKAGNGKALLRESERLGTAARRRGVTAITALLSESQAAADCEQLVADGFRPRENAIGAGGLASGSRGIKDRARVDRMGDRQLE
jgi:hypothetical protein